MMGRPRVHVAPPLPCAVLNVGIAGCSCIMIFTTAVFYVVIVGLFIGRLSCMMT